MVAAMMQPVKKHMLCIGMYMWAKNVEYYVLFQ